MSPLLSDNREQPKWLCSICDDVTRDRSKLLMVARDTDIQAIERSGIYDGLYFVLGGTISLLNPPEANAKLNPSFSILVEKRLEENLSEMILAFSINPDGEKYHPLYPRSTS